ncbi:MAG: methylated-DNA--[protein]-cysteine S-methyltransferase [Geminicoccaceae bacterium]
MAHDTALVAVDFGEPEGRLWQLVRARFGSVEPFAASDPLGAVAAMRAYLGGELEALDRLPVDGGGTPFQREVWAALREIPAGTTWSYKKLAEHIGRPAAVRAVGLANGSNPLGIVVPCHRVVGSDGSLTGYGGGLPRKRWLLEHEGVLLRIGA